jgi:hypothetical protein
MNFWARILFDGSGFQKGLAGLLGGAKTATDKIGSTLGSKLAAQFGIGALLVGLEELIRRTIAYGAEVSQIADQMGLTTDQVQRLQVASQRAGLEFENIARAMEHVAQSRERALGGDTKEMNLFERFGIGPDMLRKGSVSNLDILTHIAERVAKVGVAANETGQLMELLGRHGDRVVQALIQLKNLGPVELITQAEIEKLRQIQIAFDNLKRDIILISAPAITGLADFIQDDDKFKNMRNGFLKYILGVNVPDNNSMSTGPLTAGEMEAARAAHNMRKNDDLTPASASLMGHFGALAVRQGNLGSMGLLLSAPTGRMGTVENSLLQLQRQQLAVLRQIADRGIPLR